MPAATTTPWMVPEVRVQRVDPSNHKQTEPLGHEVVSVQVEQRHTGVSRLTLVLSNQRFDQHGGSAHPRYVFNDLRALNFGDRLRVDVRYLGGAFFKDAEALGVHLGPLPKDGRDGWVPLILARVTELSFSFPAGGASQLTVAAEDLLSLFDVHIEEPKTWVQEREDKIVSDVLAVVASGLGQQLEAPGFSASRRQLQQPEGSTQLQFLEARAKELDFELFVDFADPTDPDSEPTFCFQRARSWPGGVGGASQGGAHLPVDAPIDLVYGLNLLSFSPHMALRAQLTGVTARGYDPIKGEHVKLALVEVAARDLVAAELYFDDGASVQSAVQVRQERAQDLNEPEENITAIQLKGLGSERGQRALEVELLENARGFLTADLETFGLPALRPGRHVRVQGYEAPFDGIYYVTQASHSVDDGGYRTRLRLRRPGYLAQATRGEAA